MANEGVSSAILKNVRCRKISFQSAKHRIQTFIGLLAKLDQNWDCPKCVHIIVGLAKDNMVSCDSKTRMMNQLVDVVFVLTT